MVAETLVIDASAALAVVLQEPMGDAVRSEILRRASARTRRVVPEIFWIEVTNALAARHGWQIDAILEAVASLDGLELQTVQAGRPGLLAAIAVMTEHGLTAYDATYVALAETLDAELLTLDHRLADAASQRAVVLDPNEVREAPGEYRLDPWITWSGAAEYLEAVRRTTLEELPR